MEILETAMTIRDKHILNEIELHCYDQKGFNSHIYSLTQLFTWFVPCNTTYYVVYGLAIMAELVDPETYGALRSS